MGRVEALLSSKIGQIKSMMDAKRSQVGFSSIRFSDVLSQAIQDDTSDITQAESVDQEQTDYASIVNMMKNNVKTQYEDQIQQAAYTYQLDPNLLKAVIQTESSFRADAVSGSGAMGLMQLMPGTAEYLGVKDAFDPQQNINGGASYLRDLIDRFGDIRVALAAYNCGPGRISSLGITDAGIDSEYNKISAGVRGYVAKVLSYYDQYTGDAVS